MANVPTTRCPEPSQHTLGGLNGAESLKSWWSQKHLGTKPLRTASRVTLQRPECGHNSWYSGMCTASGGKPKLPTLSSPSGPHQCQNSFYVCGDSSPNGRQLRGGPGMAGEQPERNNKPTGNVLALCSGESSPLNLGVRTWSMCLCKKRGHLGSTRGPARDTAGMAKEDTDDTWEQRGRLRLTCDSLLCWGHKPPGSFLKICLVEMLRWEYSPSFHSTRDYELEPSDGQYIVLEPCTTELECNIMLCGQLTEPWRDLVTSTKLWSNLVTWTKPWSYPVISNESGVI